MSVYVNLEKSAFSDNDSIAELTSSTKGGDIVVNPSDYQIGVNRFKVPLSSIPLFRIYDGQYKMGIHMRSAMTNIPSFDLSNNQIDFIDFAIKGELLGQFADRLISNNQIQHWGIETKGLFAGRTYRDIHSQEEFVEMLNISFIRAFCIGVKKLDAALGDATNQTRQIIEVNDGLNPTGAHTHSGQILIKTNSADANQIQPPIADTPDDAPGRFSGKSIVLNTGIPITRAIDSSCVATKHTYITSIRVEFNEGFIAVQGAQTNGTPNFTDISCWLRRVPISDTELLTPGQMGTIDADRLARGDSDQWCIFSNIFEGQRTTFTKPFSVSTNAGTTQVRENRTNGNFNRWTANFQNDTYDMFLDYTTTKDIIGKRFDGYRYELFFINNADYNNRLANNTVLRGWTIPVDGVKLVIENSRLMSIREIEPTSGQAIGNPNDTDGSGVLDVDRKLMPYFSYDYSKEKINYNISNHYLLGLNFLLLLNNKLNNLLTFDRYIIDEIKDVTSQNRYIFNDLGYFPTNSDGVVIQPKATYGGMGSSRNNRIGWWTMNAYEEEMNSKFRRDWLNGIVITSPNLSLNGEIVGDGKTTRKILTDFQIDPSSTARDYLIFFNSGGMRLYTLKSMEAQKDIDIIVEFKDIYGTLRPLIVKKGEECNVKLEFRPNSQIYNLNGSVSSFQY